MEHTEDVLDGRYRLDDFLGSGGTGTVHRAWDLVLERPVALKQLRAGAADAPTPYIVMQFVEGVSLAAVLKERRRLPAPEVMAIVAQVAEALAARTARGSCTGT